MVGLIMKYFVLKPKGTDEYAEASRRAMYEYAKVIDNTNPLLAQELQHWANAEEVEALAVQKGTG